MSDACLGTGVGIIFNSRQMVSLLSDLSMVTKVILMPCDFCLSLFVEASPQWHQLGILIDGGIDGAIPG